MAFNESMDREPVFQAFTVSIPAGLQTRLDALPAGARHTLLGELFRLAAQAGQERALLPRFGPVTLEFQLAGCEVSLELDAPRARLTLVALTPLSTVPRPHLFVTE